MIDWASPTGEGFTNMIGKMMVFSLLCAPIGLAWAGILSFPLLRGMVVASLIGAALALFLEVHNSINAKARLMTIEEEQGKLPDEEYKRQWEIGKLFSSAGLDLFMGKLAFFIAWVSLLIWGIVALFRAFL